MTKAAGEGEGPPNTINANYFLGIDASSGVLVADYEEPTGPNHPVSGTTVVTSNVWHHAAVTYDASNGTWKLYLDGVLDRTLVLASAFQPNASSLQHAALGSSLTTTGTASGFFNGALDEARIWNIARSDAQIAANFDNTLTSGAGLLARYGLDEGTGTTTASSVAGAPNGTLTGAAPAPAWTAGPPLTPAGNGAPVFSTDITDQTDAEGEAVSLDADATDPDLDTLTYSATGLPGGVTINPSTGVISGTLAGDAADNSPYSVVITVSDGSLTDTDSFSWTVTNTNQAPVFTTDITDQTDAEGDTVSLDADATDPDLDTVTYSASPLPDGVTINPTTGVISGTLSLASAGTYNVTVTASDGSLPDFDTFTWTVTNTNQAPVFSTDITDQSDAEGDSVSLDADATDADAGTTLVYSATGLPGGVSINASTGVISGTLSSSSAGTHNVVVTVSDGALTDTDSFTWTVVNANQAPVFSTDITNQTDAEGDIVSLDADATDPDLDGLTYSATGLPNGVTIDANTGVISGTLSLTSAGTHSVIVTVSDDIDEDTDAFTWTVTNTNQAPVFSTDITDQTDAEGEAVSLDADATDPDLDTLTYSATGLPGGVTINPSTGVISGTLAGDAEDNSPYSVVITVSDGSLTDTDSFSWTVTNTNQAPVFTTDITDQTDAEGDTVSLDADATDPDLDTVTYSASPLPDGVTINPTTGVISGTLSLASAGTYNVTVTASDGSLPDTDTFTWTVTNTNQAPVFSTDITDQSDAEGDSVSLDADATDADAGTTLVYSATGLPGGVSINSSTGVISGTLSSSSAGTHNVVVTVSDGALTDTDSFTWTVVNANQAPVFSTDITNQTDAEGDIVSLDADATDPDLDTLTYSASNLPDGVNINPSTGVISGTLSFISAGTHNVTITVSDGTDTDTDTFTWTVSNTNRAPVFSTEFGDRTDAEGAAINFDANATDPDAGTTLVYSATGLPAGVTINSSTGIVSGTLDFAAAGSYSTVITASDGTLTDADSFTWTVTNTNQAPVFSTEFGDRTDAEGAAINIDANASDPDAGTTLVYSATGLPGGLSISSTTGIISGTLNATSSGTHNTVITVTDGTLIDTDSFTWTVTNTNQAPVFSTEFGDRTDAEGAVISFDANATDPDVGTTLVYSATGLPGGITINSSTGVVSGTLNATSSGTYNTVITVSDGSLTDTDSFTWTVTEPVVNQPPVFSTEFGDRTDAEGAVISLDANATDPDAGTTLVYSATGLPGGITINSSTGVVSGTLNATSSGTYNTVITVSDGTLTDTDSFTWTVTEPVVNQPPVFSTEFGDRTDAEGAVISLDANATDPDAGTTLVYSATGLPGGITINSSTGVFSGTLNATSSGTYNTVITVSRRRADRHRQLHLDGDRAARRLR